MCVTPWVSFIEDLSLASSPVVLGVSNINAIKVVTRLFNVFTKWNEGEAAVFQSVRAQKMSSFACDQSHTHK
jgi:hypothetical protein